MGEVENQLNIKGVNKFYKNFQALKDINLSIDSGEFVAILGESGSGKSTLLNVISGLDSLESGEITINGISTRNFSPKEWATYRNNFVGIVFQEYNLIDHLTVVENVELPLLLQGVSSKIAHQKALEKCKLLGLAKHAHKLPKKISGGQQQRAAIARALVTDPLVILADEPTGALDSENATIILDVLKVLSQDHIVILVTHDEEFAQQYATRIVLLEDGEIASDTNNKVISYEFTQGLNLKSPNMRLKVMWKFAKNNLLKRKFRTLFTSLTMSFGLISIFLIIFLVNGIRTEVTGVISSIIPKDQYFINSELTNATLTDTQLQFVQNQDLVNEAYFQYSLVTFSNEVMVQYDAETYYKQNDYSLYGIPTNEKNFFYRNKLIGTYPQNENEVIISSGLAEELLGFSIQEKELPQVVDLLKQKSITVDRISNTSEINETFNITGVLYNTQLISYTLNTKLEKMAQTLPDTEDDSYYQQSSVDKTGIVVYFNSNKTDKINQFEDILTSNGLVLKNPVKVIFGAINDFFDTILYVLVGTASISLIVSGILVGLMIYISVLERIKEIGVLTSLGARKANIRHLFIFESGFIGLLSSTIALVISLVITWIINMIFDNTIGALFRFFNIGLLSHLKLLHIDIISIVVVLALSILYSIICGFIPAFLASRLKAVEALRKE